MHNDNQIIHRIERAKDALGIVEPEKAKALIDELSPKDWARAAQIYAKDASKPDGFYIDAHGGDITIHNDLADAKKVAGESNFQVALDQTNNQKNAALAILTLGFGVPTAAGFESALAYMAGGSAIAGALLGAEVVVGVVAAAGAIDYGVNLVNANTFKENAAKLAQQPADLTLHSY